MLQQLEPLFTENSVRTHDLGESACFKDVLFGGS